MAQHKPVFARHFFAGPVLHHLFQAEVNNELCECKHIKAQTKTLESPNENSGLARNSGSSSRNVAPEHSLRPGAGDAVRLSANNAARRRSALDVVAVEGQLVPRRVAHVGVVRRAVVQPWSGGALIGAAALQRDLIDLVQCL